MKEKKKRVNGRRKGSNFERKVAKIFSKWMGMEFRRTPLSGGWSHNNPDTSGDLICMEKNYTFPLHIECKDTEAWSLEKILKGRCKEFTNWYNQVDKAISKLPIENTKLPIIIFSKNNSPIYMSSYVKYYKRRLQEFVDNNIPVIYLGDKFIIPFEEIVSRYTYHFIVISDYPGF